MFVASTELKRNLGKFLKLAEKQEMIIIKRGKPIAKLVPIKERETPITNTLFGVIKKAEVDLKKERAERLKKYESAH
ncbi:MAG: type II toxin-antitoxin system prevent-host-death family antitoxin [Desulfurellaceae bacterium]|nr:type II toxin-antitoxin system prevent-host-death family antitoxin [Desulfurellaceae bacterium]